MIDLYLDAFVLACPPSEAGEEGFRKYILNILSWKDLRVAKWTTIYISKKTYEDLAKTNSYPPWGALKRSISTFGIEDVQPKDVVDIVNGFLEKSAILEDVLKIDDILFEDVECSSPEHYRSRHPVFVEHYERLVMLACLRIILISIPEFKQIMISLNSGEKVLEINLCGRISYCQYYEEVKGYPAFPITVAGSFYVCNSPQVLDLCVNPCDIWTSGHSEDVFRKALEVFVYQQEQNAGSNTNLLENKPYRCRGEFFLSLERLNFTNNPTKLRKLFRACAETIIGLNMQATHWLRTGEGGNSPQRLRGQEGAWRRDIDDEYRLHYWQTEEGPEFASIVIHNDMNIPE